MMPSTKIAHGSAPPNKGASRALDKKCLLMTFPPEPLVHIQINFTELFLMMASIKKKLHKQFARLNTGVARALDEKCLKMTSHEPLVQI